MIAALHKHQGSVLLLTLMFLVTLTVITTVYFSMIRYDIINSDHQANGARAFYIAEAGINKAVWYLANAAPDGTTDGSWRTPAYPAAAGPGPRDPQQESFGGGQYTIWVEDSNGSIRVTSRGLYEGDARTVHELDNLNSSTDPNTLSTVAGSWGTD